MPLEELETKAEERRRYRDMCREANRKTSRPILYSAEMVRAYFDGKKTETRRPTGLEKINESPDDWKLLIANADAGYFTFENTNGAIRTVKCPFGRIGDVLYGRETWATTNKFDKMKPFELDSDCSPIFYCYYEILQAPDYYAIGRWRPSLHMPKWASRIHQTITGLKCQRLWDISLEDCWNEGIQGRAENRIPTLRHSFKALWDSIYGKKYPRSVNPFVWVLQYPKYEETK